MRAVVLVLAGLLALATASSDKKVVCYFGSWAVYRQGNGKFDIDQIDPQLCTHLIYTFVGLAADGSVRILDAWADLPTDYGKNGYGKFNKLREQNPKLKTMIALGGWNEGEANSKYSQVMASPSLRANFVKSVVEFVEKHDFDGFDLDWEYPGPRREGGRPQDKDNLVLALKELKEAFAPRGLILSAAVAAGIATAETAYNIAEISKYLDFINLMEYDFHTHLEKVTGHNSPMYAASWETDKTLNIDSSVQYWLQQGAPAEKLVLGIPLYARGFTLADASNNKPNSPAYGGCTAGPYTRQTGFIGYNEICENMNKWTVVFDEEQRVPYAYSGNQWISYDNERSIAEKGDYVNKHGLGGMMIWSLETDDFRGVCGQSWPLLKAINNALSRNGGSHVPVVPPKFPKSRPVTIPETKPTAGPTHVPANPPSHANQPMQDDDVACQGAGFVRDPKDCSVFYQCVFDGSAYKPVRFACSSGLAWNTMANICDFKHNVQC